MRLSVFPRCKDSPQIVMLWWKWLGLEKHDKRTNVQLSRQFLCVIYNFHGGVIGLQLPEFSLCLLSYSNFAIPRG